MNEVGKEEQKNVEVEPTSKKCDQQPSQPPWDIAASQMNKCHSCVSGIALIGGKIEQYLI